MKNLIFEQMQLGPMENYVYFLGCQETRQVAVVDPGWDVPFLLKRAKEKDYQINSILLTHGHPDHIEGVDELLEHFNVPVYLSDKEADFYTPECKNLNRTADHQIIKIGKIDVECIHTPGHTPGCQCYRAGDILLTGDVLFISAIGRCDIPGSNLEEMYNSLYNVILKLPDSLVVYPGHQYGRKAFAPLGEIRKTNPYLTCRTRDEFFNDLL